jgi:hypothetical protein
MYPEGTLVQVVKNINNHWYEIGELITVTEASTYCFMGCPVNGKILERYRIGGGPQVRWREVVPAQPLEQLLKECLE